MILLAKSSFGCPHRAQMPCIRAEMKCPNTGESSCETASGVDFRAFATQWVNGAFCLSWFWPRRMRRSLRCGTKGPLRKVLSNMCLGGQCLPPPRFPESWLLLLHPFICVDELPFLSYIPPSPPPTAFIPLDKFAIPKLIKKTVRALNAAPAAWEPPHKFQNVTLEVSTSSFLAAKGKDPPQCKLALQQRCQTFFSSPSRGKIQDCRMIKPWQLSLPSFF